MADVRHPGDAPIHSGNRRAQAQLDWLDHVVLALEQIQKFVCAEIGGTDGVVAVDTVGVNVGKVEAKSPASMSVKINECWGFVHNLPLYSGEKNTSALDVPISNPRIDTVSIIHPDDAVTLAGLDPLEIHAVTGREIFIIRTGAEDVSPVAPTIGDNELKLAEIHHRVGETSIKNTDDSTNGYITDFRVKKNF